MAALITTSSQATLQDRTGGWWISTPRGLFRFPRAPASRLLANGNFDLWLLPSLQCRRLLEDRAGNIWVETKQANVSGLAKWDAGRRRVIDLSTLLPQRARAGSISALADDGRSLWLGLGRPGGLLRLRGETKKRFPIFRRVR